MVPDKTHDLGGLCKGPREVRCYRAVLVVGPLKILNGQLVRVHGLILRRPAGRLIRNELVVYCASSLLGDRITCW